MQDDHANMESHTDASIAIRLTMDELRMVAGFAVACAERVLPVYERHMSGDTRPRESIEAGRNFSNGSKRTNGMRTKGMAAFRAASETVVPAAGEAAKAATQAVGSAFLHPIPNAHQVWHILGAAAHAARAAELDTGDDRRVGEEYRDWAIGHIPAAVIAVLVRYPEAPTGGGRTGEILREIDGALRQNMVETKP